MKSSLVLKKVSRYILFDSEAKVSVESFLLFSQSIPSQNLGFVDPKATVLDLIINDRDLNIRQSPTILSSTRSGGTTGAGDSLRLAYRGPG